MTRVIPIKKIRTIKTFNRRAKHGDWALRAFVKRSLRDDPCFEYNLVKSITDALRRKANEPPV